MNKHCVSLKLAKQMKELGWEKETLFEFSYQFDFGKTNEDFKNAKEAWFLRPFMYMKDDYKEDKNIYLAPTCSEILEELPGVVTYNKREFRLRFFKWNKGRAEYSWGYWDINSNLLHDDFAPTPSEALGKLYCYLKKYKFI